MDNVNINALYDASRALFGDNGAATLYRLYRLLEAAEARGHARGYESGFRVGTFQTANQTAAPGHYDIYNGRMSDQEPYDDGLGSDDERDSTVRAFLALEG